MALLESQSQNLREQEKRAGERHSPGSEERSTSRRLKAQSGLAIKDFAGELSFVWGEQ